MHMIQRKEASLPTSQKVFDGFTLKFRARIQRMLSSAGMKQEYTDARYQIDSTLLRAGPVHDRRMYHRAAEISE